MLCEGPPWDVVRTSLGCYEGHPWDVMGGW